ncbi:MAG: HAMP domain-containing protein, partial [Pirellulaceae bacterium]|nr:HAMP domain-containing protein [Pirellulaceae bacterium]
LTRLGQQVDVIAEGDFDTHISVATHDEVAVLGDGVDRMSSQLQQMWASLNRTQGEKLLHQIAGGLAHQLRNSLTGARMAVELHHKNCNSPSDEFLDVALAQLEQTDDSVRRLLLVAAGKQDDDHPGLITVAIDDVRNSVSPTAKHLHVDLVWHVDDQLADQTVVDSPSLTAALSNLVLNAMQAAKQVTVRATCINNDHLHIAIIDDGPGPPSEIADELFEPFVTSKPEGLGLGLPLVARAATRLGGEVKWDRIDRDGHNGPQTRFELTAKIIADNPNPKQ